ncbi:MAG: M48 family metallopeptidase [Planctomycetes bacterium]|nr:M48 family metallopeptidase [Planctomycetota bacterium]HRV80897.1 M48 family metallopeptidase [Planctomycetota bacterium]
MGLLAISATGCQALANFNAFPPAQDVQMGMQAYTEILSTEKVIDSGQQVQLVRNIMARLVEGARAEKPDLVDLFEWEVKLIDNDQTVNAFCLPGGKMAVYTGIIPVAQTETGLAVVMGHEISHALMRHGTKAVTRQMGISVVLQILSGGEPDQLTLLASNLVGLKFGREAEYEADALGLRLMARAGYNPEEAVSFWQRMNALSSGAPPEWLSTHPSNENRISQIQDLLPQALELYQGAATGNPAPGTKKAAPKTWNQ